MTPALNTEAAAGLALKTQGIQTVLGNNEGWSKYAMDRIRELPSNWTGTGEDIRNHVDSEPSHPNAWGGLINRAIKADLIFPTGDYQPMSSKKSHGRRTPVYGRI